MGRPDAGADGAPLKIMAAARTNIVFSPPPQPWIPMKYLVALLLLAWPLAAAAEPQSIADCEKIKGDLAYNQCLASFGPPARSGAAHSSAGEIDAHDQEPEPQHGAAPRRGRVSYGRQAEDTYGRRRGGRQRMSFEINHRDPEERASRHRH